MALDTFAPTVRQSPGTRMRPTVKVRKAQFGDGYSQRSPDGTNNIVRMVDLTWSVLLESEATAIITFFESHLGSTPFYYAMQDGVTRKWTCETWTRTWDTPNQVTATFEQYFGLET